MTGKEIKTPCLIPHQDHYGPRDAAHAPVDARQAAGSEHYAVADLYALFRAQTILRGDYSLRWPAHAVEEAGQYQDLQRRGRTYPVGAVLFFVFGCVVSLLSFFVRFGFCSLFGFGL